MSSPASRPDFCPGTVLLQHDDGDLETGWAWGGLGYGPPDWGAWAECYDADFVCGVEFLFSVDVQWLETTMDAFVWEDDGQPPPGTTREPSSASWPASIPVRSPPGLRSPCTGSRFVARPADPTHQVLGRLGVHCGLVHRRGHQRAGGVPERRFHPASGRDRGGTSRMRSLDTPRHWAFANTPGWATAHRRRRRRPSGRATPRDERAFSGANERAGGAATRFARHRGACLGAWSGRDRIVGVERGRGCSGVRDGSHHREVSRRRATGSVRGRPRPPDGAPRSASSDPSRSTIESRESRCDSGRGSPAHDPRGGVRRRVVIVLGKQLAGVVPFPASERHEPRARRRNRDRTRRSSRCGWRHRRRSRRPSSTTSSAAPIPCTGRPAGTRRSSRRSRPAGNRVTAGARARLRRARERDPPDGHGDDGHHRDDPSSSPTGDRQLKRRVPFLGDARELWRHSRLACRWPCSQPVAAPPRRRTHGRRSPSRHPQGSTSRSFAVTSAAPARLK